MKSRSCGLCGDGRKGFLEDGFEQAAAFGLGGGELCFELVAHGHKLIDECFGVYGS